VPTPVVTPTNASGGPVDETAVLQPVRDEQGDGVAPDAADADADGGASGRGASGAASAGVGEPDGEVTTELPQPPVTPAPPGAADETTVLPQVAPGAGEAGVADETAVLPPVRDAAPADARGGDIADRVPPGYFRDERPAPARPDGSDGHTRELPQVEADGSPRRRPRPDWAEETPHDDLPTLADELLGPRGGGGEEYDDGWGGGRGDGRGDGHGRGRGLRG
jgi:dTMP kinase